MNIRFKNETIPLQIQKINDHYEIQIHKEKHIIKANWISSIRNPYQVFYCTFEWKQFLYKAIITENEKNFFITINGKTYTIEKQEERIPTHIEPEISEILSPLPGTVSRIYVQEGQEIQKDDILVIIESMKMENQILSPKKAKIETIYIKENQKVEANQLLIKLI